MKLKIQKKEPRKWTDWSFDHLLGTLGAIVQPDTLGCMQACKGVVCIMVTQYSYCTCETPAFLFFLFSFLEKATPAQPAPVSRRIPFSGDSGGGKRVKCITLAHELLHAKPENSTVFFLSSPKWVKEKRQR